MLKRVFTQHHVLLTPQTFCGFVSSSHKSGVNREAGILNNDDYWSDGQRHDRYAVLTSVLVFKRPLSSVVHLFLYYSFLQQSSSFKTLQHLAKLDVCITH